MVAEHVQPGLALLPTGQAGYPVHTFWPITRHPTHQHTKKVGPLPNRSQTRTPPHKNYCGSHLLSHNHQVAVPSARMGLATGIGTVNRAFPHHYHHRKTNQTTTTRQQRANGSGPRTAQRTRTPQCKQPTTPHQGAAHATNEHTKKTLTHTPTHKG
jgi:hypothetical protein